jgi:tocopherol O-methyltransferase
MIVGPAVRKSAIRFHYDALTPFYRLLWGPHVHHGLWADGVPVPPMLAAQDRLVDLLATQAKVRSGEGVLDVGCGMGGSSLELARRGCRVLGVTLSPVQQAWATASAALRGLRSRARFRCLDAERMDLPPASIDVMWNVECSEHLHDKPAFFANVAGWLRPGGRVALCAWLAGDGPQAGAGAWKVCDAFLCPSLGTADNYRRWLADAGLEPVEFLDLTRQVEATWEVCQRRIDRLGLGLLSHVIGRDAAKFTASFRTLLDGYRDGSMRYGLFVSRKPAPYPA